MLLGATHTGTKSILTSNVHVLLKVQKIALYVFGKLYLHAVAMIPNLLLIINIKYVWLSYIEWKIFMWCFCDFTVFVTFFLFRNNTNKYSNESIVLQWILGFQDGGSHMRLSINSINLVYKNSSLSSSNESVMFTVWCILIIYYENIEIYQK